MLQNLCLAEKTAYRDVTFYAVGECTVTLFKYLTPGLAVAAQLQPSDMAQVVAAGFTRLVNNRPDGEEAGQPDQQDIRAAAEAAGLEYHYLPVLAGGLSDANITEFVQLASTFDQPVLMFCRTGTRCTHLWALQQAQAGQSLEHIVASAHAAGYDLQGLLPRLQEQ